MDELLSTYDRAVEFLYGRIDYERLHADSLTKRSFKLDRMAKLLDLIGNPQRRIPVVHVAGTKGKGSTVAMISEVLRAAGIRVGSFTSPHIASFTERMTVCGIPPTPQQFVDLFDQIRPHVEWMDSLSGAMAPTFFEICTALAWLHFVKSDVQLGVFEVGLGGRLDSTNICEPEVCVITSISYDHTAILGKTLAAIAGEKAGIIKPGSPVVSGVLADEAQQVVADKCSEHQVPLYQLNDNLRYEPMVELDTVKPDAGLPDASQHQTNGVPGVARFRQSTVQVTIDGTTMDNITVGLPGQHQLENASLAVATACLLRQKGWEISDLAIRNGLQQVRLPLRIEVVCQQPLTILDAAHNGASVEALIQTLNGAFEGRERLLIFAVTRGKEIESMLRILLPQFSEVILTEYENNPRALPLAELEKLAGEVASTLSLPKLPRIESAPSPRQAWVMAEQAVAKSAAVAEGLICVTGSFFVAAEMRQVLFDQKVHLSDALTT